MVAAMGSLESSFVEQVIEPVQIIDVPAPIASQQPPIPAQHIRCSTLEELSAHLNTTQHTAYSCRYISICQRNSWRPLQITRPMLDLIVARHGIDASFWELPSCFYTRNLDVEEVYCVPYTETRHGSIVEISYSIKYPEHKPAEDKWVIRHSALYHRHDTSTNQSVFIHLSPTPNSKAHLAATAHLLSHNQLPSSPVSPFHLHSLLFTAYTPAWRAYIASLERRFLPIANTTFATFIDEPLRVGYDNLSTLVSIETRFLQIPAILETVSDTLGQLCDLISSLPSSSSEVTTAQNLQNHRRQCVAQLRAATHLQQRAQRTSQLLADTLSFRDQVVAKEQNGNMLQLNKSAVFITTLTLLYLPASFVASFFGMNFFGFEADPDSGSGDNNRIAGSSMVWIYVVVAGALTVATFVFYYWLLHRDNDGAMFRCLAPKIRAGAAFEGLTGALRRGNTCNTRRMTSDAKEAGVELRGVDV
ncbi:hypothetical protein B0T19DRAFT_405846 [Cercophora scortea]|uniref:CorA-like transporter domain-containing protein n=1 Tax=Cercophora scortea TaxID=314031 RepID=A0AAE0J1K9_9PEZI|nr:hypothetical protein B0T19DRAFT_405846 [Cercophora scortea]